jgi:hypothetical protein
MQGRIQDFKLEGTHLKKLRRAEGGAKIVGVFRVKNHDFTPLVCLYLYCHCKANYKEGTGCDPIKLFNLETGLCPYFDFERTR